MVDATTSVFTYDYQDTSSPLAVPAHAMAVVVESRAMKRKQQPEMLGAGGKMLDDREADVPADAALAMPPDCGWGRTSRR